MTEKQKRTIQRALDAVRMAVPYDDIYSAEMAVLKLPTIDKKEDKIVIQSSGAGAKVEYHVSSTDDDAHFVAKLAASMYSNTEGVTQAVYRAHQILLESKRVVGLVEE